MKLFEYLDEHNFFILCTGTHGPFGSYRAFPTLLPNVFKGINEKNGDLRYFKQKQNPDYNFHTYSALT